MSIKVIAPSKKASVRADQAGCPYIIEVPSVHNVTNRQPKG